MRGILMTEYRSQSAAETCALAREWAGRAVPGQVYALTGDLGTGKTVFAKGFAEGLGVAQDVTSPTFAIINEYAGRLPLYHFDVYRINSVDEMEDTGYEDYFYGKGVCLVEWAELVEGLLPADTVHICIEKDLAKGENYRLITVRGQGHAHIGD